MKTRGIKFALCFVEQSTSLLIYYTFGSKCLSNKRTKEEGEQQMEGNQTSKWEWWEKRRRRKEEGGGKKKSEPTEKWCQHYTAERIINSSSRPNKQLSGSPLRRETFAATLPNGTVGHRAVFSPWILYCFFQVKSEKRQQGSLINLPWCSRAVALLPLSAVVHRTGFALSLRRGEFFPRCAERAENPFTTVSESAYEISRPHCGGQGGLWWRTRDNIREGQNILRTQVSIQALVNQLYYSCNIIVHCRHFWLEV